MSNAGRRSMLGAFGVVAIVVTMASFAWACTAGQHTNANLWFCKFNVVTCTELNKVGTSSANGASTSRSYYSMLGGQDALATDDVVSPNSTLTLRWTTGDHRGITDDSCRQTTQSGAFQANGANASFQTSSTGVWAGKGPVSMPAAGTYTICTVSSTATEGVSNHMYPFVVV